MLCGNCRTKLLNGQYANRAHCKRQGSAKSTFWQFFWRALIFSGVAVLQEFQCRRLFSKNSSADPEEFQCRPLKVTKSQNFTNNPCKFPCLYNDPSLGTVDLRPFFALKKSTYLFRGYFLRPSNNTFKPSIETTSRGCFYLLKLILPCVARLLLKHNLTNFCTPFHKEFLIFPWRR